MLSVTLQHIYSVWFTRESENTSPGMVTCHLLRLTILPVLLDDCMVSIAVTKLIKLTLRLIWFNLILRPSRGVEATISLEIFRPTAKCLTPATWVTCRTLTSRNTTITGYSPITSKFTADNKTDQTQPQDGESN